LQQVIKDGKGDQEFVKLLLTMHEEAIESIILNSFVHKYSNDIKFHALAKWGNDACAGIYVLGFSILKALPGCTHPGSARKIMISFPEK